MIWRDENDTISSMYDGAKVVSCVYSVPIIGYVQKHA